ncbi:GNAT family N-acetyltransferase [Paenibacillus sp. MWE-103]|uniref:GNAT family N-acetyltransferase n=1 Tax=Paenibacillus artemisiicola TaxID=1172618 RepID=A0ABS3WC00_9BACL|nr:GNAT family N-acetyltransferase [Paenibacillus artemisiicola]MBO7745849.1 GNAT family N-acetyltransferase [Paenibacillus artemisiicola]
MSERIRLATEADAERLQAIIYGAYATIRELELHWPAAHADVALIRANVRASDCYVLEEDGDIVATVTHSKAGELKGLSELPFLKWFAVDPARQGQGYGGRLLDWTERKAAESENAPAVLLATAEKHPWLLPMYERRGYERFHAFDPGNGDGMMHLLRKPVEAGRAAARETAT